jgi:hypothetical protein
MLHYFHASEQLGQKLANHNLERKELGVGGGAARNFHESRKQRWNFYSGELVNLGAWLAQNYRKVERKT